MISGVTEPVPRLAGELAPYQELLDRLMAKERAKRPATEKEWQELVKPLLRPFKLPKAGKPEFGDLPKASEREKTRQSGAPEPAPRRPAAPRRRRSSRRRLFLLNLLLVAALAGWIFFNYERIPSMMASLARTIIAWISSLLAKI